jgi:hypothetical protein
MQERIQPQPGSESNWLVVDKQNKSTIWLNKNGTINIKTIFKEEPVSFIYFSSMPKLITLIGKNQSSNCLGFEKFSLGLKLVNKSGSVIDTKNVFYTAQDSVEFPLTIPSKEAAYLLLEFQGHNKRNENSYCSVYIKDLAIANSKK